MNWKVLVNLFDIDMNQNIQINTDTNNKRTVQVSAPPKEKEMNPADNFIQNQKQKIANNMMQSATEQITRSWYEKCICGLEYILLIIDF
jgi:hypothetical protein